MTTIKFVDGTMYNALRIIHSYDFEDKSWRLWVRLADTLKLEDVIAVMTEDNSKTLTISDGEHEDTVIEGYKPSNASKNTPDSPYIDLDFSKKNE